MFFRRSFDKRKDMAVFCIGKTFGGNSSVYRLPSSMPFSSRQSRCFTSSAGTSRPSSF